MKDLKMQIEKMQDNINILRNELDVLKQTPNEQEGIYELSEATESYHLKANKKFIEFKLLDFPVYKYFIDEIQQRSSKLNFSLNKELELKLSNLIANTFKNEEYVLVLSSESDFGGRSITKQLYKTFSKNKIGKITKNDREDTLDIEYSLDAIKIVDENSITASYKRSYLNVISYDGQSLENQNVILLNDEFGINDELTKLLIDLKPKSMLNILFNCRKYWFDNIW